MSFVIAAISLGFLGSFHCIGMCGPIALALPIKKETSAVQKSFLIILYNFGRIVTYSSFGLLFGLIGQSINLLGFQQVFSVSVGLLVLIGVFLPASFYQRYKITSTFYRFFDKLKHIFSNLFINGNPKSLFTIGLINGFLPCGLVYLAIAGSLVSGNVFNSVLFMMGFGLGTLPMMLLVSSVTNIVTVSFRNTIRRTIPVMTVVMAVMLIMRGLNLGIPYISPKFDKDITQACHIESANSSHSLNTIQCIGPNSQHKK